MAILPFPTDVQQALAGVAERLRRHTVQLHVRAGPAGSSGAGIVWDDEGLVVTNAHVARTDALDVVLADGRRTRGRVEARAPGDDLAAVRVDPAALAGVPTAVVGDAATLRPGDLVVAHGHPLGVEHALAAGVVHRIDRASPGDAPALVRADVRLAPGNSGGPLADADGRVVGVNCAIVGGLGVAIATPRVRRFLAAIAPRPSLGVSVRRVTIAPAGHGARAGALLVLETDAGGAADRAGVRAGDVLLAAGAAAPDTPLADAAALAAALRAVGPGGTVLLRVGRAGRSFPLAVPLGPAVRPRAA
jgi:serine protease Do